MNAAAAGIGISRLGQIAITVHDVERATAFYRDTLGLTLLFTAGKLAFFDCGGVRLMLDVPEKPEFDLRVDGCVRRTNSGVHRAGRGQRE